MPLRCWGRAWGRLLLLDEFADASLLHLAEGIARKLVDDEHLLRHLEPGKALACQCPQRLRVGIGARLGHDDGDDHLAEIRVGPSDDRRLEHAVEAVEDLLRNRCWTLRRVSWSRPAW